MEEAELVTQLLRGQPDRRVAGRQPMDRQTFDDPDRHWLVGLLREAALNFILKRRATLDDGFDFRQGAMGGVILERFPITIKRDDAGQVARPGP